MRRGIVRVCGRIEERRVLRSGLGIVKWVSLEPLQCGRMCDDVEMSSS